tara:strand:+ start:54 stop:383 length:330 start_codon:yes stop_codon:yes gene_type:complete
MCFGGSVARMTPPEREFKNRPVTVTGRQTGVDNPIDTAKFTEDLKIQRQKEEGTYVDPNLTTVEKLTRKRSGMNQADRKARKDRQQKAKHNYNKRKFSKSITGRRTGVA